MRGIGVEIQETSRTRTMKTVNQCLLMKNKRIYDRDRKLRPSGQKGTTEVKD